MPAMSTGPGARPNLLFILSDQLRRGVLGCYGMPEARTPRIDSLAASGVRFAAACSSFPVCLPYRFTLMTGQRALSRGVPCTDWRMSPAETTLADPFNAAGYRTIYLGKWHLFGTSREAWVAPSHRGRFAQWEGWEARADDHFTTRIYAGPDRQSRTHKGFQTDILTDRCIELLADHKASSAQPFFFMLSVEPPHPPYTPPPDYLQQWQGVEFDLPANFYFAGTDTGPEPKMKPESRTAALQGRRAYHAMVQNLDDNVGRILDALDRLGLAANTIVVFTSDHGQMDGAHALLNSIKRNPYEEAIGVPLVVRDPRRPDRAGAVVEEIVGTEDLFPTLLGLCGLSPPGPLPGLDCTALIQGRQARLDRPGLLLYLTHHKGPESPWHKRGWRAMRTRDALYACWGPRGGDLTPWHLYDLDDDPLQMNELVKRDEPRRKSMEAFLRAAMIEAADVPGLA
jgi:arylsulfatase A-like enzyme